MPANNIMTGGRPTEQIDADFANPDKQMDLVNDGQQWRWTHDDWYQFLDITPEYLTEKCRAKGIDADETLRVWNNMLHHIKQSRAPAINESLGSRMWNQDTQKTQELKYFAEIPPELKRDIKSYHNTVKKEAERKAYQECNLKTPQADLEVAERNLCRATVLCRPPTNINDAAVNRLVNNDADYDRVEASILPESEKNKYRRCRALGETCPVDFTPGTEYDVNNFSYLTNGGTGDCLFIAVYHYINLCEQLASITGDDSYPNPGIGEEVYDAAELEINKLQTLDYRTLKDNAAILRNQVCDYYRDHPNYILFAGRSIKHELAILNMEGAIYTMSAYIKQYNDYVNSIIDNNPLGLSIVLPGTKKVLRCPEITHAINMINLDRVEPEIEDAWNDFVTAMYNNYVTKMRDTSTYGGHAEIIVLSKILQKNIFVLQLTKDEYFTANMGATAPGTDDIIFIYHNASVTGKGSLHYEVMFPLDSKYIEGSAIDASSILEPDPVDVDVDVDVDDDDGLDMVRAFIDEQCGLDLTGEDEDVVAITLDGCLREPDLDKDEAIKLYFKHKLQYVRDEQIFNITHDVLFQSDANVDQNTLYNALLPLDNTIDVVTNNIIPYMSTPNIFQTQYMAWFNMLDSAHQQQLLHEMLDMTIRSVNIKKYNPSTVTDKYNQDAENRLILYTMSTKPVQDIVAEINPFPNPEINENISIIHSMIKIRRKHDEIIGESTHLSDELLREYKQHWSLDEEDEPNYDDDNDIEPILEIMLFKQISETIEGFVLADVSEEFTQLVLSLRYLIVRLYSQVIPTIALICKKNKVPVPDILIPTEENTTLHELLNYVSIMEMYVNITHDPVP